MTISNVKSSSIHDSYSRIDQYKIELFAERLIRKHLLLQYVATKHPVLVTEEHLVQESDDSIRHDIQALDTNGQNIQLVEMVVLIRTRNAIRVIIRFHDIEADTEESALLGAVREAFTRIAKSRVKKYENTGVYARV